jgi:hypothetical protein
LHAVCLSVYLSVCCLLHAVHCLLSGPPY